MAIIDYKEKYEKAVQAAMLAKQDTESAVTIGILEEIFPELREPEDERIMKELIAHIKWCEDSGYCAKEEMTRWITFLEKQGKQKPVEPQQDMLSQEKYAKAVDECIYGEQKPAEWSEKDELMLGKCIDAASGYYSPEDKQSMKDWLYSLKDRVQPKQEWKPSDEQMDAFYTYLYHPQYIDNSDDYRIKLVISLYEQLKKLKG